MNEEEAKTKERMEMEFSNPENFQKVDPQLAEEEEAMIEGSSVPMMRSKKSSQKVFEEEEDVDKLKTDMEGMKKSMAENRQKEMDYIVETVVKSERIVAKSNVKSIEARKNAESAEMNAMNARELLDEKKDVSQEEMSNLEAQIEARIAQDIPKIYASWIAVYFCVQDSGHLRSSR